MTADDNGKDAVISRSPDSRKRAEAREPAEKTRQRYLPGHPAMTTDGEAILKNLSGILDRIADRTETIRRNAAKAETAAQNIEAILIAARTAQDAARLAYDINAARGIVRRL